MSSHQTAALFDAVPEAVVLVEFVAGEPVVRDCNDTFLERFGHTFESLSNQSLNEFIVPDDPDQQRLAAEIDTAAADGKSVEDEVSRTTADGIREFLFRAVPIEAGDTMKSIGIYIDITDRRRERQRYEALIEHSYDVITILDTDGTVRYESPSVEQVLGYTPDDLVGENVFEYVHPDDQPRVLEEFQRGVENSDARPVVEYRFRACDGSWRWLESLGSNHIDHPPIDGYVVNSRDITERYTRAQELEQQRDTLQVLNQMLRHDVRNDLQLITAHAEIVADHVEPASPGMSSIETLTDKADHVGEMIQTAGQIASLTLSAGNDRRPVALGETLAAELDDFRETAATASITVDGSLPEVTVTADEMLDSVFRNLLNNAIQHNDKEVPRVTVSATTTADRVQVRVADNGPGLSESRKEEVFAEGEMGLDSDGTGIGLSLVRTLVDAYGGDIRVEDNDPEGAVFVVNLPIAD